MDDHYFTANGWKEADLWGDFEITYFGGPMDGTTLLTTRPESEEWLQDGDYVLFKHSSGDWLYIWNQA